MNINLKIVKSKIKSSLISQNKKNFRRPTDLGVAYLLKIKTLLGLTQKGYIGIGLNTLQRSFPSRYLDWNAIILRQSRIFLAFAREAQNKKEILIRHNFYKGVRYTLSLPVRGQRTHTNAQTARKLLNVNK